MYIAFRLTGSAGNQTCKPGSPPPLVSNPLARPPRAMAFAGLLPGRQRRRRGPASGDRSVGVDWGEKKETRSWFYIFDGNPLDYHEWEFRTTARIAACKT